jgi:hypothetical protein
MNRYPDHRSYGWCIAAPLDLVQFPFLPAQKVLRQR